MGSTYQTVLATGGLDAVRAAVARSGQAAAIIPVGDHRWAVVPRREDGFAETADLAALLSAAGAGPAVAFQVFDSDVLTATIYRNGELSHEYVSDQSVVTEFWDDDNNEILVDFLGRSFEPGAALPRGPFGADPEAFAPAGVEPVDRAELAAALTGPELMAESQHHAVLHALNLQPRPLQMTYEEAMASGLTAPPP